MVGCVRKIVENLTEIKVQNVKEKIIQTYYDVANENKVVCQKYFVYLSKNASLISTISFLNSTCLLCMGLFLVAHKEISLGLLIAFTTYSKTLATSLDSVIQLRGSLQPTLVSIQRIMDMKEVYNQYIEDECKLTNIGNISRVTMRNMDVEFRGRKVFQNFNYSFDIGITGIQGSNGSGKTTLMNIFLKNSQS